jgi:hypothetical protein
MGREMSLTHDPKGFPYESNPDPLARRKVQISEGLIGNGYFKENLPPHGLKRDHRASSSVDHIEDLSLKNISL